MRIIEVMTCQDCPQRIWEEGQDPAEGTLCEPTGNTITEMCTIPEWCPLDEWPDIERLVEWFGDALGAADYDLRLSDKDKSDSWKKAIPMELFDDMKRHADIVARQLMNFNHHAIDVHSIKIANYALMIATRVDMIRKEAEEEDGKTDTD